MAWRPHGRARVDSARPSAFAVCDRCNLLYNLDALNYQFDWRGIRLANLRIKVCRRCLDKPFPFFRPIILPPDPVPRSDPRPENFDAEMGPAPIQPDYLIGDQGDILVADDGYPLLDDTSQPPAPFPQIN